HEVDRLPQAREALLELGPLAAPPGGDLVERVPRADAEEDAPRVQQPHGGERLRDDGRVVAEGGRHDARADEHVGGALPHGRHPGEGERRVTALVAPWLEVVGGGHRLEAVPLGGDGELDEVARRELLGGGLVPETKRKRHVVILSHVVRPLRWRPALPGVDEVAPRSAYRRSMTSAREYRAVAACR